MPINNKKGRYFLDEDLEKRHNDRYGWSDGDNDKPLSDSEPTPEFEVITNSVEIPQNPNSGESKG